MSKQANLDEILYAMKKEQQEESVTFLRRFGLHYKTERSLVTMNHKRDWVHGDHNYTKGRIVIKGKGVCL